MRIAFEGISGTGKSSLAQIVRNRIPGSILIEENRIDRLRPVIADLHARLKEKEPLEAVLESVIERSRHEEDIEGISKLLYKGYKYASSFHPRGQASALLAYLFTSGRKEVDNHIASLDAAYVIHDRWQITGWAYQADPFYPWEAIRDLHAELSVTDADLSVIVTGDTRVLQDRIRSRMEATGKTIGTDGRMSCGKEEYIESTFIRIYEELKDTGKVLCIENSGRYTLAELSDAVFAYAGLPLDTDRTEHSPKPLVQGEVPFHLQLIKEEDASIALKMQCDTPIKRLFLFDYDSQGCFSKDYGILGIYGQVAQLPLVRQSLFCTMDYDEIAHAKEYALFKAKNSEAYLLLVQE